MALAVLRACPFISPAERRGIAGSACGGARVCRIEPSPLALEVVAAFEDLGRGRSVPVPSVLYRQSGEGRRERCVGSRRRLAACVVEAVLVCLTVVALDLVHLAPHRLAAPAAVRGGGQIEPGNAGICGVGLNRLRWWVRVLCVKVAARWRRGGGRGGGDCGCGGGGVHVRRLFCAA